MIVIEGALKSASSVNTILSHKAKSVNLALFAALSFPQYA
jgi:hypothetical protein